MEIYDPIEEQYNRIQSSKKQEVQKKKVAFDKKNYLSTKLESNETEKKITVRILNLTPDSQTPFEIIQMHYLPSKKTSYVCAKHTENLPDGVERNCPFCDLRDEAKEAQKGASEIEWNKLKEIYKQNGTMANYIVRLVDRDDQSFGIKFWKFSEPIFKMIYNLYKDNKEDDINIFDYLKGKDLVITIEKQKGKSKITGITAKNKQSPLAETEEERNKLITDEKTWNDVYSVKPYGYLELLIEGKEPFFDKEKGEWVENKKKKNDDTESSYEEEYLGEIAAEENQETEKDELPF